LKGDFIVKPTENPVVNSDISSNQQPTLNERTKEKVYRQLKRLESSYNPEASTLIKNIEQGREILLDQASITLFNISPSELEPTTFDDAWNHPNSKDRELWRAAINKKLGDMDNKKVWEIINKEDVPEERRTIKCEWIYKIKRNGIFRARLVACGYSQIPGIDFNESFAPVINNVSFCIILIAKIMWGLQASIIDVETAFLHGQLSEEIYMNAPDGMNIKDNKCLQLKKTIYGLVQSAREFYKRLICELKDLGHRKQIRSMFIEQRESIKHHDYCNLCSRQEARHQ
jgi:Reverse transcriptase (RNA-dependent DNA polymerase)